MIKLALLFLLGISAFALDPYVPIASIPTPDFGTTEDVAMYLNPAKTYNYSDDGGTGAVVYRTAGGLPYTYYVHPGAPGATDTGNPHGSPGTPRITWPYPLIAGDCVQIHGTTTTFSNAPGSRQAMGGTGTAANPIFYYGIEGDRPNIQGRSGLIYTYGDYIIIEQIKFVGSCGLNTNPLANPAAKNVEWVVVRDCEMEGDGIQGNEVAFSTGGSSGTSATRGTNGAVVLRCYIHDYGDFDAPTENDAGGFIFSQFATNCWILDTEVTAMGGDGGRIGADQGDLPSGTNHYIGRNHFHHNRENGVDVKQAHGAIVAENLLHDFTTSSSSNGEAVVIHYDPSNLWFINNRIYNAVTGITSTGVAGGTLYTVGNTLTNHSSRALYFDRGGGNLVSWNDTIDGCANGIICTGTVDSLNIVNAIISNITDTTNGFHVQIQGTGVAAASNFTYGQLYQASGNVRIRWAGATYTSLAAAQSGVSGEFGNSVQSDPVYVGGGDYRLQVTSPAIGVGLDMSALNSTFQAAFGTGVTLLKDYYGVTRPSVGSDKGAYEYDSSPPAPDDSVITTLNVGTLNVGP